MIDPRSWLHWESLFSGVAASDDVIPQFFQSFDVLLSPITDTIAFLPSVSKSRPQLMKTGQTMDEN